MGVYQERMSMIEKQNELYAILNQPILKFMYEPIFAVSEHKIIGYNAILRTQNSILKTFEDVVHIARLNNKLYDLERLGLESVLKHIQCNEAILGNSKIFFNSITNEMIEQDKISEIDFKYKKLYTKIVCEIIDSEHCNDAILKAKNLELHKRGVDIALGKYGTSFSNDSLLLNIDPAYIKLSYLLTRGVDKDESRQQLILNIISYAKTRNIKIIASNVDSDKEFETLTKMGVEYFYGNLFCAAKYNICEILNKLDEIYIKIDEMACKCGIIDRSNIDYFTNLMKYLPSETALTKKEKEIVFLMCSNKKNIQIADILDISLNTLKTHIRNIFNKFNISGRKDLFNLYNNKNLQKWIFYSHLSLSLLKINFFRIKNTYYFLSLNYK